jgi:MSHA biogenesis protein MshL
LFEVNYLNVRRSLQRRLNATPGIGGQPPASQHSTTIESDLFGDIGAGVQALLSPSGRFHVDRKAGLVQVTDFADRLDRVSAYLEAVHVRVNRQVRLDVRVLEVTLSDRGGLDWAAVASRAGSPLLPAAPGVATAGLRVGDLDALVKAIAEQGTVRMIAAPQTVAMNNEPAVLRATTGGVYAGSGPGRGSPDHSEPVSGSITEGVTLTVTPYIDADGMVQLNVAPTWAEQSGHVRSPAGDLVPALRVSEADTVVRVQEGETVVISGLLQERADARPSAGLSGFFGAQERRTVRVELVVLLTPTVVRAGAESEGVR